VSDDARILELAEEALNSGLSAEEVCADHPDLVAAVKERLNWSRGVDMMVDDLFPSTDAARNRATSRLLEEDPPEIPGYEMLDELGRGGVGVVYRVRHVKLNRVVALKMLLSGRFASGAELRRFMREARAVASLGHPNIVQVHDVGDLDGQPYFTMEFVDGGSLARKLAGQAQPAVESATLVATLARAVHAAHGRGIVHRDLKPGNILLAANGLPKITDFGLAANWRDAIITGEQNSAAVLTFERVGTPSYMAPEQVIGSGEGETCPSIDIYALGAILYEMLTGQPPFHGATSAETQRKVVSAECVPPSRLNHKVPRDLETICLKCLKKSPKDRYETAAALADDLERFCQHEPIKARSVGFAERVGKWVRRKPAAAIVIALVVVLVIVAGTNFVSSRAQNAKVRHDVDVDLQEVRDLEAAGRLESAGTALRRAEARLDERSADDLRQQVSDYRRDLDVATRLDAIHLNRETAALDLDYYPKRADAEYEAVFRDLVKIPMGTAVEQAAPVVSASRIHGALVAALDYWAAACAHQPQRRSWILQLARQSDPDPNGWRDQLRDPSNWNDSATLEILASQAPITGPSVSVFLAVGERLEQTNHDSAKLLRRVQQEFPADFWANLTLGDALNYRNAAEAGLYYRAALAARPEAAVGYGSVGDSLGVQHEYDEAIEYYKKALAIDPNYARAEANLADALKNLGRYQEAIDLCNQTLKIDPNYAWAHYTIGGCLRRLGHPQEALAHDEIIYRLVPDQPAVGLEYRGALMEAGRGEEARVLWKHAIDGANSDFNTWTGYPDFCLFVNNPQEYHLALRTMLQRFGGKRDYWIATPLASACLLLPKSQIDQDESTYATKTTARAMAANNGVSFWQHQYYQFLCGWAEYRDGDSHTPVALMAGLKVLGPCPRLVAAMALNASGKRGEALSALAGAIVKFDWRAANATWKDSWTAHVLRREAESSIVPNLPALLDGTDKPRDNEERLVMLASCQFRGLDTMCINTLSDALDADPKLLENRSINPGFISACAASALSLANEGQTRSAGDRARLQLQACGWLRDELAMQMRIDRAPGSASRAWLKQELIVWREDPRLADLRTPAALQSLTPQQRDECAAFWKSLDESIGRL
jgi:serine/threonine-protein kinase